MKKKLQDKPKTGTVGGITYQQWRYGALRKDAMFKVSKWQSTWWKKDTDTRAVSINGQLSTPMRPDDLVWVDFGAPVESRVL